MQAPPVYDAAVVGLGPVGAVMCGLLALCGLRVVAVERAGDVYDLPRAVHFDDEAMRVFAASSRSNMTIVASVSVMDKSAICAASVAIRRRSPKSFSKLTGATAPSRANLSSRSGCRPCPRFGGKSKDRRYFKRSKSAVMLAGLVECG